MFWRRFMPAASLLVLALAAYAPAFNGAFLWDDDKYIALNETLRSADGLARIWSTPGATIQYYPLVYSTFWVEYHLWGLKPIGYIVVNTLLHGTNAILLWLVLRRLGVPGAWLAAAIFAVHPVHVESVAWIQERKNVLSGCFFFAAILAYLQFAGVQSDNRVSAIPPAKVRTASPGWYILALALALCALFSKTVTCSLPAVLALLLWWKRERLGVRDWLALVPFFVLSLGLGLVTVWVEKRFLGAEGADFHLSVLERCLLAGRALWFYAGKLILPVNLVFIYPRWHIDATAWWQYLFPLAAVAVLALLWLWRGRIGKGPLVAVLFFAGVLLPTLGFVNFYFMRMSFVADHFLYLPSAGLLALAAALMVKGRQRFPDSSRLFVLVAAAVLLFLGGTTWMQERHFSSQEALWTDTLAKNSECWLAHNNLGNDLMNRGEDGKAFHHLNAALILKPDYDYAHYNLGVLLARHGKFAEAGEHLREALRLAPDGFNTREHLGWVCQQQHELDEAARYLVEETEKHPDSAHAFYLLGTVREEQQNWTEACACLRRACVLRPQESLYQAELSKALRQKD